MDTHELNKIEALGEGITVEPCTWGYGSYFVRVTGTDHTEQTKPFTLNLSLKNLNHLCELAKLLEGEKDAYELREKQIGCKHATVDGICVECGAQEDDYPELATISYNRRNAY